jgi:tRNA1Val (adenine37-N6)-methyltransferase
LKYGGTFYTVYRPERLPDLMEALRANRLEPKKLTFVHATAGKAPSMVLVASRLGGNPSLTVTPPLLIYRWDAEREYTDELKRIYESCSFEDLEGFQ